MARLTNNNRQQGTASEPDSPPGEVQVLLGSGHAGPTRARSGSPEALEAAQILVNMANSSPPPEDSSAIKVRLDAALALASELSTLAKSLQEEVKNLHDDKAALLGEVARLQLRNNELSEQLSGQLANVGSATTLHANQIGRLRDELIRLTMEN